MPRSTQEWWYHFQPDGSTGTLRVDFKSFFWQIGPQFCFPSLQITEIVLKEAKQATFKAITIPETFLHFMFKQKAILDLRSFLQYTCFYSINITIKLENLQLPCFTYGKCLWVLLSTFSRTYRVTVEFDKLHNMDLLKAKTWFICEVIEGRLYNKQFYT